MCERFWCEHKKMSDDRREVFVRHRRKLTKDQKSHVARTNQNMSQESQATRAAICYILYTSIQERLRPAVTKTSAFKPRMSHVSCTMSHVSHNNLLYKTWDHEDVNTCRSTWEARRNQEASEDWARNKTTTNNKNLPQSPQSGPAECVERGAIEYVRC